MRDRDTVAWEQNKFREVPGGTTWIGCGYPAAVFTLCATIQFLGRGEWVKSRLALLVAEWVSY